MSKKIDETGHIYGELTVLKEVKGSSPTKWLCRCSCGKEIEVLGKNLRNGNTKSCGCLRKKNPARRKNLIGQRFGKLTVIGNPITGPRGTIWECKCDCGNVGFFVSSDLVHGNTKSCGCLKRESHTTMNDLTGQRFGRLIAIKTEKVSKDGQRIWLCQCDCGNQIEVLAGNLRKGNTYSCGCINSKGNIFIKTFLTTKKIPYKAEYSFQDCLTEKGNKMKFDFCIFNENGSINCLIEYDGDIHYTYNNNSWNTYDSFLLRKQRDEIKNDYCKKHNLKLIRISYLDNLKEKLEEIINEL